MCENDFLGNRYIWKLMNTLELLNFADSCNKTFAERPMWSLTELIGRHVDLFVYFKIKLARYPAPIYMT